MKIRELSYLQSSLSHWTVKCHNLLSQVFYIIDLLFQFVHYITDFKFFISITMKKGLIILYYITDFKFFMWITMKKGLIILSALPLIALYILGIYWFSGMSFNFWTIIDKAQAKAQSFVLVKSKGSRAWQGRAQHRKYQQGLLSISIHHINCI